MIDPRNMAIFIGQSVHREPSDQTDLRNGVDATLGGGGVTFWKLTMSGLHGMPTIIGPIPAGPLSWPNGPSFSGLPS
jgi:hypothetical protein